MNRLIFILVCGVVMFAACSINQSNQKIGRNSMLKFDHVGLVTDQKHQGEDFVAATRVWVTNPNEHPFRIEWLRFELDSPVEGPVRTQPHIAFSVPDLAEASKGMEVLIEPFDVGFAVVGFYKTQDGAVVELMEYKENAEWKPQ